ncbi:Ivy family c-type lysozyme inhibitor [Chitinimonas sp. BJB300]|uniref:Ivy family c-type lysozyme inhibitor n=1 Tax=Chitinimonas sp. BJB300 TaxID=1559339 RepID=UPI000C11943F|nr:Ivy family c-type lysozyme inhibitor [Chitinimonas sp. BJB300]PHV11765.1 hypothetical protein CSQ89_09290 [Chitinimonas sp. BJB300]TSJ87096.1 hypothetical protein FG002_015065 [Chitinimonas sp. BJB300]
MLRYVVLPLMMVLSAIPVAASEAPYTRYAYEVELTDPAFKKAMRPLLRQASKVAPWVNNLGVVSPGERVIINGQDGWVYQGCQPHGCPNEGYVLLYLPAQQNAYGLFWRSFDKAAHPDRLWLGKPGRPIQDLLEQQRLK